MLYHGLDEILLITPLFRHIRFLLIFSPNYWFRTHLKPRAVRVREALEDLGPIFVKFGQTLSTRKDILPVDIADELVKLQDKVPPFSNAVALQIIESQLGQKATDAFAEFNHVPLASASVAQVHTAVLHSGEQVIVKVLRPGIEKKILSDIRILFKLAYFAEKFWDNARLLRVKEVVAEFKKTILNELNLAREAANATKLRNNFKNSDVLYVPEIYWQFTRQKVLVMERIYGIPIGDIELLQQKGANFKLLAERGVEIFFTQVFRDNFFHADMHPGNIFVELPDKYMAVDFGIVGTLCLSDQLYLAENFLGFFNRDYHRVAEVHIESGWVPSDTSIAEFESAICSVCEPIFNKPLSDISFGLLLLRLFQTARRFDMVVQPQLILLQKTLLNIEGMGRQLYPELDLWHTAKPFLENWFSERIGVQAKIKKIANQLPEIPSLIFKALDGASQSKQQIEYQNKNIDKLHKQIEKNHRRTVGAILVTALLASLAILLQ